MPPAAPPRACAARARARAARLRTIAASALLAAPAAPAALAAQDRPPAPWERRDRPMLALAAAGLYDSPRTTGNRGVEGGGGFEVQGLVGVSALALGVGYQRTVQPIEDVGNAPGQPGDATFQGLFVEPRVSVAAFRNFTPYLSGRVSFLQVQAEPSGQYAASTRRFVGLGAGLGTLVSVAPSVQLDLAAQFSFYGGPSGGNAAPLSPTAPFRGGNGPGALLRAGVVIGLDRWGR